MNRFRLTAFLGLLFFAATAGPALGGLTLSADPSPFSIAPGQATAIDVYVTSSDGGDVSLGLYDLTFEVVSSGGVPVTFTTPGSSTDPMYDPNTTSGYVFEGVSSDTTYPGTPSLSPPPPGTQIELSDFTNTFTDVTINSKMLLAVLYITAPSSPPPSPGGESLSVNLLSATLTTAFGVDVPLTNPEFSISGELQSAAVPEPSSLVLTLIGISFGALRLRRSGDDTAAG